MTADSKFRTHNFLFAYRQGSVSFFRLRKFILILSMIVYALTRSNLCVAQLTFRETNLFGGSVAQINYDSCTNVFFASTLNGLYFSTNQGIEWQRSSLFFEFNRCDNFFISYSYRRYFASSSDEFGYNLSIDSGFSWTPVFNLPRTHAAIGKLNFSENSGSGTIVAPAYSIDSSGIGRIFRSTDGGNTWNCSYQSIYPEQFVSFHNTFCTREGIFYVTADSCLFRSSDDGVTWQQIRNGLGMTAFSPMHQGANQNLFVGGYDGSVFRSLDNGLSWNLVRNFQQPINSILSLASGEVLVASNLLYCSNPSLTTWTSSPYLCYSLLRSDISLFGAGDGIIISTDSGTTWQARELGICAEKIIDFDIDDQNNVFAISQTRVFASSDNGQSWQIDSLGFEYQTNLFCITAEDSNYSYASDMFGTVFRTSNAGHFWQIAHAFSSDASWVRKDVDGTLLIDCDLGLCRSTDHGITWNLVSPQRGFYTVNSLGYYFAATFQEGYLRSTNRGATWQPIHALLSSPGVSMYVDERNTVFLFGDNSLIASSDNGVTWTDIQLPSGRNTAPKSIVADYTGTLYLAYVNGIYRKSSVDTAWHELHLNCNPLKLVIGESGYLYVSTFGQGLFRSHEPVTNVEDPFFESISPMFGIDSVYPNPFNSTTMIHYRLPTSTKVELAIYDLTGRKMTTFFNKYQAAGDYQFEIDMSQFASGNYFVKINTNQATLTKRITLIK